MLSEAPDAGGAAVKQATQKPCVTRIVAQTPVLVVGYALTDWSNAMAIPPKT
jgi:hypothetical protein